MQEEMLLNLVRAQIEEVYTCTENWGAELNFCERLMKYYILREVSQNNLNLYQKDAAQLMNKIFGSLKDTVSQHIKSLEGVWVDNI